MIRTRDWKYVHRYPHGPHELHDLTADPDEEHDLSGTPDHAAVRAELAGRLGPARQADDLPWPPPAGTAEQEPVDMPHRADRPPPRHVDQTSTALWV
ncbi:hypothetical protein [Streptomyces sp. NPDC003247]|uniref:hypothetical protein n=1 Tax=Streptomyces sp. NPDC003247 TaxID=3364677 RepID=UPI003682A321